MGGLNKSVIVSWVLWYDITSYDIVDDSDVILPSKKGRLESEKSEVILPDFFTFRPRLFPSR